MDSKGNGAWGCAGRGQIGYEKRGGGGGGNRRVGAEEATAPGERRSVAGGRPHGCGVQACKEPRKPLPTRESRGTPIVPTAYPNPLRPHPLRPTRLTRPLRAACGGSASPAASAPPPSFSQEPPAEVRRTTRPALRPGPAPAASRPPLPTVPSAISPL